MDDRKMAEGAQAMERKYSAMEALRGGGDTQTARHKRGEIAMEMEKLGAAINECRETALCLLNTLDTGGVLKPDEDEGIDKVHGPTPPPPSPMAGALAGMRSNVLHTRNIVLETLKRLDI